MLGIQIRSLNSWQSPQETLDFLFLHICPNDDAQNLITRSCALYVSRQKFRNGKPQLSICYALVVQIMGTIDYFLVRLDLALPLSLGGSFCLDAALLLDEL